MSPINGRTFTVNAIARWQKHREISRLLDDLKACAPRAVHRARVALGLTNSLAAELFALVVLLCDELLQLKHAEVHTDQNPAAADAIRFFAFMARLPIELQMLVCHRAYGSARAIVKAKDTEGALLHLVSAFSDMKLGL